VGSRDAVSLENTSHRPVIRSDLEEAARHDGGGVEKKRKVNKGQRERLSPEQIGSFFYG